MVNQTEYEEKLKKLKDNKEKQDLWKLGVK